MDNNSLHKAWSADKITESVEGLTYFKFKALLQRDNWLSPAYVGIDNAGIIKYLSDTPPTDAFAMDSVDGYALPGFQNSHSHAFQYAMAGLAETHPAGTHDDFWSWREAMYQCALSVDPDQVEAIATMLYAEMVRHGYTQVAEFHYLHHDKEGNHYNNPAELGERMVAAAKRAGIKITLVPVFYQKGTFGQDPQPRQRRFISKSVDEYFKLFEASKGAIKNYEDASIGFSIHSLRAVDFKDIMKTVESIPSDLPFHIHVAEQKKEIKDCFEYCGKRPMQWVLDNLPVNERFHLVHSTHLDDSELSRLAKSGARVVLCPSTEGNLGDGIFRMKEFVKLKGRWSIGTDSHIGINPLEELRMIDYRQRLVTNERNTFEGDAAHYMINEGVVSGRKAMGIDSQDNFEIGRPLDALVLDAKPPLLAATSLKNITPTIVYSTDTNYALGILINGKWIVKNNRHADEMEIRNNFSRALSQMKNR
ncbi:MAG: formimidoylglutamate deiminase [Cyclobacteriaceae bacterium]|nr:formimidoylglutamate deiminase [Cyclobacteriaceae bacterium]